MAKIKTAIIYKILGDLPYLSKWVVFLMDVALSVIAFIVAYIICYSLSDHAILLVPFLKKMALNALIVGIFFIIFKTHTGIIRYSTFRDALRIALALLCANLVLLVINDVLWHFWSKRIFQNVGFFINFVIAFFLIISKKMTVKLTYEYLRSGGEAERKSLLIYGISLLDAELGRLITKNQNLGYKLRGFIVSSSNAANKKMFGVPVYYGNGNLENLLIDLKIDALLINPLELERNIKQQISDICFRNKIELLSAPSISEWKSDSDMLANPVKMEKIRIEDLLGRIPIEINTDSIGKSLSEKCVLVTGAAGSIGSEIVRQVSKFEPGLLLLCDSAESPIHQLRLELEENHPHLKFQTIISDVRYYECIDAIFEKYKPQVVYHAAAYKHVPLMEEFPCEAVMTNVLGTKNVVDSSIKHNVNTFVMISTDKAVNPANVMGCSKRIAEIYVQSKTNHSSTRFITTRFGNVLGSNGSVIPRFEEQIKRGGPVTVTHKDIIRYFMTIPEACRLVLEAGNMGKGGEIFVFDMGDPVRISEMAEKMIRLSGFEPGKDIKIKYTGLRPGEKLYEELLNDEECTQETYNRKIRIAKVREYDDYTEINKNITSLIELAKCMDNLQVVKLMKILVPEFVSMNSEYSTLDTKN